MLPFFVWVCFFFFFLCRTALIHNEKAVVETCCVLQCKNVLASNVTVLVSKRSRNHTESDAAAWSRPPQLSPRSPTEAIVTDVQHRNNSGAVCARHRGFNNGSISYHKFIRKTTRLKSYLNHSEISRAP